MINANIEKEFSRRRNIILLFLAIIIFTCVSMRVVKDSKKSAEQDFTECPTISLSQLDEETISQQTKETIEKTVITAEQTAKAGIIAKQTANTVIIARQTANAVITARQTTNAVITAKQTAKAVMNAEQILEKTATKKCMHIGKKYQVTDEEYDYLCYITLAESTSMDELLFFNEDMTAEELYEQRHKEMVSIASVILRRTYEEDEFPNDVKSIIFQAEQFSTAYSDGYIYMYKEADIAVSVEDSDITEEIRSYVDEALDGIDPTEAEVPGGAIYFYSDRWISKEEREKRADIPYKVKFADTVFYRDLK